MIIHGLGEINERIALKNYRKSMKIVNIIMLIIKFLSLKIINR